MKIFKLKKIPNIIAVFVVFLVSVSLLGKGISVFSNALFQEGKTEIEDNTEVELDSELTYYLKVKYDGVDVFGVESSNTTTANITSNRIKVTDYLPNGLTFKSFVETSDGTIGAVSRSDSSIKCGGRVIDDTPDSDGQWNEEHTEYTYHGLHYDDTKRMVWFYAEGVKAGCELTVGINTQTPSQVDDPNTDAVETRRDFYNTAIASEGALTINSNTTHAWIGRDIVNQYHVTYEYIGDVPNNAPSLLNGESYAENTQVNVASEPTVEGYTFSGWSSEDVEITNGTFTMPDKNVVIRGSFEQIPEPTKYDVIYKIDGDSPESYILPKTKSYFEGTEIILDLPKKGEVIDGYTFLGWTSSDVSLSETGFTMPDNNVTIKGKFERISYTISYNFQGEIMPPNAENLLPSSEEHYPGDRVTLADDPEADGYGFTGWYSSKEFIMPEQDVAVAGEWLEQDSLYTIRLIKEIDNPKDVYKKGDKVIFRITVENENSFPVTDVVLKELLDNCYFIDGKGYKVESDDIVSISSLNPYQKVFVYSEFVVPSNDNTTYTNRVELLGALAEGNNFLDTSDGKTIASVSFDTYSGFISPFTGDKIKTIFIIMVASLVFMLVTIYTHKKKILEKYNLPKTANYAILGVAAFALLVGSLVINFKVEAEEILKPKKSIDIASKVSSYKNEEPGSWNVTKSAEWTSKTTAKINFDINSVTKLSGNDRDIILVIDNSTSMNDSIKSGDNSSTSKISAIKSNASELIRNTLDNQDSQIAIVSFASDAETVAEFTNDADELINSLNDVEAFGSTNYYKALVKVEELLEDYEFQDNRDVVVVFVTDGLPVKDTPAEVSKYTLMKLKYPQLTINGVQYDMGESIIPQLARITDNQFIVTDASQLDKSLFEASGVPYYYTSFDVTDYINTEVWEIQNVENPSIGNASIHDDLINWDLGRYYRPGKTANLTINIKLKDQYRDTDGIWKTNIKEEISSTILDGESEYVESTETPVLQHKYNVSYDANLPAECRVEVELPETKRYFVFDQVEIQDIELSCNGWNFMGWQIATEKVHRINTEYFQMPSSDVILRATWTKLNISKSTSGVVHEKVTATFDSGSNVNNKMRRLTGETSPSWGTSNTKILLFRRAGALSSDVDINNSKNIASVSNSQTPIYIWFDERNGTIYYYTEADKIYLNNISSYFFAGLSELKDIADVYDWDSSRTTDIGTMFRNDSSITSLEPLRNWDVSNVKSLGNVWSGGTFQGMQSVNDLSPLENWDVSNVEFLGFTFCGVSATNLDALSGWNISKVKQLWYTFCSNQTISNLDGISDWDTSNVVNMSGLFSFASAITDIDALSNWNTSKVVSMESMFLQAGSLRNIDGAANWDTSNVTDMGSMFSSAKSITNIDGAANWDTSKVKNMTGMFSFAESLENIDGATNWNTSNVTKMSSMFENAIQLQNIDGAIHWNTGNVTTMSKMFYYNAVPSGLKNVDGAKNWNTSKVTTMQEMFRGSGLTQIDGLANWDVSNITENGLKGMFSCSPNLKNVDGLADWNPQNVTNLQEFLNYNTSLENIDGLARWDMSHIINMASMFTNDKSLQNLDGLKNWDVSNVTDMRSMFASMYFDDYKAFKNWDTGNVTNMAYMFNIDYYNQKPVSLEGLENWDVSKVTDMNNMFKYNRGLTNLDELANWDVSSVEYFNGMFDGTENLQDISGLADWDTSSAKTMSGMFSSELYIYNKIESLEALANWDVSNVEDMSNMFRMDRSIKNLNGLANWDTGKVKKMNGMFQYDYAIEDISSLAEWNVENLTSSNNMFDGDNKITNLIVLNNWNTHSLETSTNMFYNIPDTVERPTWYTG